MSVVGLPEWAVKLTDEEWDQHKIDAQKRWNSFDSNKDEKYTPYTNCVKCGKRLILTLCSYSQPEHYCVDCCPEHLWQTEMDWEVECARCGVGYTAYLESVLDKHEITYNTGNWVVNTGEEDE